MSDASINTQKQIIYEEGGTGRGLSIYVFNGLLYVGGWDLPDSGWSGTFLATAPGSIANDTWRQVALVFEGGPTVQPNVLRGYLDGAEFATGEGSQISAHGDDIGIGRSGGLTRFHDGVSALNSDGLDGLVDELRAYDVALTETDITTLYNADLTRAAQQGGGGGLSLAPMLMGLDTVLPSPVGPTDVALSRGRRPIEEESVSVPDRQTPLIVRSNSASSKEYADSKTQLLRSGRSVGRELELKVRDSVFAQFDQGLLDDAAERWSNPTDRFRIGQLRSE